ncbi:aldo/keto reductase [Rhodococcus sp. NPDC059234]|uniref:aldo/keto reductase n=1 Tax=Rhodococcus sp. NPDC059234 TaxID=3346781 RepID=UPI00366C5B01
MDTRNLGRQGLNAAALGYGAMGTATGYGPTDDTESIAAIRKAHELGVTMFDTAEMYGWGEGEKLLGQALAPIRDDVLIATKFGLTRSFGSDSRPEHIRQVVEASLRNLRVDTIDMLYQHRPDPNVPIEDVIGTMKEFVEAGKVKYLGLSEADEATIRAAHAVHPISALQSEYSIFARDAELLFPTLEELGIGFVAYSPLARGFLSGAVVAREHYDANDFRQHVPWWAPEYFDANAAIVDELTALADRKDATLAQLSLAWLLTRRDYIVPIPGSRNPQRVDQNATAVELGLTPEDLAAIELIAPTGGVGGRM